jgi:hypothetical protein
MGKIFLHSMVISPILMVSKQASRLSLGPNLVKPFLHSQVTTVCPLHRLQTILVFHYSPVKPFLHSQVTSLVLLYTNLTLLHILLQTNSILLHINHTQLCTNPTQLDISSTQLLTSLTLLHSNYMLDNKLIYWGLSKVNLSFPSQGSMVIRQFLSGYTSSSLSHYSHRITLDSQCSTVNGS